MSVAPRIVQAQTQLALDAFVRTPSHAVLLAASTNLQQVALARDVAAQLLEVAEPSLDEHPQFRSIEPKDGVIKIEIVREVQAFCTLKVATKDTRNIQRVVVVVSAETMSHGAQNAFLKLLEEPPKDTVFILTSNQSNKLLSTIRSRCQIIRVQQPTPEQIVQTYTALGHDEQAIRMAVLKAGGDSEKLYSLLIGTEDDAPDLVAVAKQLIQQEPYERLLQVDALSKNKEGTLELIDALAMIARAGVQSAATKHNAAAEKRWVHMTRAILTAQEALAKNGNAKLVLTELLLTL